MFMDPGSDDEDDADDIVRQANKVQGRQSSRSRKALVEETLTLLICSIAEYPRFTMLPEAIRVFSLYDFVPSLVPPPGLL